MDDNSDKSCKFENVMYQLLDMFAHFMYLHVFILKITLPGCRHWRKKLNVVVLLPAFLVLSVSLGRRGPDTAAVAPGAVAALHLGRGRRGSRCPPDVFCRDFP